jgi:hypothetical protein
LYIQIVGAVFTISALAEEGTGDPTAVASSLTMESTMLRDASRKLAVFFNHFFACPPVEGRQKNGCLRGER